MVRACRAKLPVPCHDRHLDAVPGKLIQVKATDRPASERYEVRTMTTASWDIVCDLVEVSREQLGTVRQLLGYFRASVYKHETQDLLMRGVEDLRVLMHLLNGPRVDDIFRAREDSAPTLARLAPGECEVTLRVTGILQAAQCILDEIERHGTRLPIDEDEMGLATLGAPERQRLVTLCGERSRTSDLVRAFEY